jgi:hypothetical protein
MPKFSDASVREALSGRLAIRCYPFPGAEDVDVGVRMLRDQELDAARTAAQDFVKKHKVELVIDPEFFDRAIKREIISRAFYDAASPDEPFFSSQNEVAALDATLVAACFELYTRHQVTVDPYAHCDAEEVDELLELLKKSETSAETWRLFDAPTLWSFVLSLGSRLREMSAQHSSDIGSSAEPAGMK